MCQSEIAKLLAGPSVPKRPLRGFRRDEERGTPGCCPANFEVLLTVDRGIAYQQDLNRRNIAIVILQAKSIQLSDLIPLMPACLDHLKLMQPGQIVWIGA